MNAVPMVLRLKEKYRAEYGEGPEYGRSNSNMSEK